MSAPQEMVPPLSATVKVNAEADWCLRELEKRDTNQVRKDVLASIQNAAIHYACASVKQLKQPAGNLTAEAKANRVIGIYKSFAARGIMEWITEEAGRPLPSWLTPRLMGHSTVTGADEPKLYTSGMALWKRYRKSAASIRKDFNVIWDEFTDNGNFPPGVGVEDAMEDLQQKLYILEQKRTAGKKYYSLVGATETAEGGQQDEGAEGGGTEGAGGKGGAGAAADDDEARAKGKGPANKDKAGAEGVEPSGESGVGPAEGGAGGVPAITEGPAGDEGGEGRRLAGGSGGGGAGHPDLEADDVRVYGSRPEGWLHPASLVFAMYGRPSTRQDVELKMEACSGWLSRKRKAQGAPSSGKGGGSVVDGASSSDTDVNGGSAAYPRALGIVAGGEKPRSRAKARKEVKRNRLASESLALQREALECLKNPAESEQHAGLVACLQTITEVFVRKQAHDVEAAGFAREAEARAKRAEARALSKQKTDVLYTYLKVLQERGDEEQAQKVAKTLIDHLNTIIAIPIDPPAPAFFPAEHIALSAPHVLPGVSKKGGASADHGGGSGEGPCVGNIE